MHGLEAVEKMNKSKSPELTALINITSLARILGVGRTTIYDWLYSEQLPPAAKVINKRRYWTKTQIETFLEKEMK